MKRELRNTKRRWLLVAGAIALLALTFSYVKLRHVSVPPELIGTWKTTDALYRDRSLEINLESISFVTGGGTEYTGFIDNIQSSSDQEKTLYTISYLVEGMRNQVSFYYDASGGGTIQFKNQQSIAWKKEGAS